MTSYIGELTCCSIRSVIDSIEFSSFSIYFSRMFRFISTDLKEPFLFPSTWKSEICTQISSIVLPSIHSKVDKRGKLVEREEVSILSFQLLNLCLLFSPPSFIGNHYSSLQTILKASSIDPYDDLKKESSLLSSRVLKTLNPNVELEHPIPPNPFTNLSKESKSVAAAFSKCIGINLNHKKREIRKNSLEALRILVFVGGEDSLFQLGENGSGMDLVPSLEGLTVDSSTELRERMVEIVFEWLSLLSLEHFERRDTRNRIVHLLLILMQDSDPNVSNGAFQALRKLAIQFYEEERRNEEDFMDLDEKHRVEVNVDEENYILNHIKTTRGTEEEERKISEMLSSEMKEIVTNAMENLQEWTENKNILGASILFSCVIHAHANFPRLIDHRLLLQLAIGVENKDKQTREMVNFEFRLRFSF